MKKSILEYWLQKEIELENAIRCEIDEDLLKQYQLNLSYAKQEIKYYTKDYIYR